MFGEVAESLLKMMGQSGQVPGALVAADIPAALETLQSNLASAEAPASSAGGAAAEDEDGETPVSVSARALPLIQLLEAARDGGADVLWEN